MNNDTSAEKMILLVEDQNDVATIESFLLGDAGYKTKRVANGREALEILNKGFLPDLILLDIVMPVMDGHELLAEIHKDAALRNIPVVMLTALDNAADVLKAMKEGAIGYCTKPVDPDELLRTVNSLLVREG